MNFRLLGKEIKCPICDEQFSLSCLMKHARDNMARGWETPDIVCHTLYGMCHVCKFFCQVFNSEDARYTRSVTDPHLLHGEDFSVRHDLYFPYPRDEWDTAPYIVPSLYSQEVYRLLIERNWREWAGQITKEQRKTHKTVLGQQWEHTADMLGVLAP